MPNAKFAVARAVMTENAGRVSKTEVIKLIADALEISVSTGGAYYRCILKGGIIASEVAAIYAGLDKVKADKPAKVKVEKPVKAKAEKPVKMVKVRLPVANADELDKIKAANLQRMKEVTAKTRQYLPGQVANGKKSAAPVDPDEARAEVENILSGLDSFKAPSFLTKDMLNSLV